jgi:hypothetical protein
VVLVHAVSVPAGGFPIILFLLIIYWQQTKKAVTAFDKARERVEFKLNDW